MRVKGYLKQHGFRVFLLLKSLKGAFFLPLLMANLIIPGLNALTYFAKGVGGDLHTNIMQLSQVFLPFLSTWWPVLVMRHFVENKGCEILYISRDQSKIADLMIVFSLFLFDLTLLYLGYIIIFPDLIVAFLKILLVCVFYFGLSFFVTALAHSITPALMVTIIYTLMNFVLVREQTVFPFYYAPMNNTYFLACELPLSIIGVLLVCAGVKIAKNREVF